MILRHRRWRQCVALLALDALPAAERARTHAHVRGCGRCAASLAALTQVRTVLAEDPAAAAPLPVPFSTLEARVRARLRAPGVETARRRAFPQRLLAPLAAAAALAAVTAVVLHGRAPRAVPTPAPAVAAAAAIGPAGEEMLRRMERSLAREQAARYLSEAQDVLVTVAAGPPPCPRTRQTIEVGDEARRSRDLLARRALVVEGGEEVASAQPVLAEVEEMLRAVAALPSCVRPGRLQALEREIGRRRLLMKIDLMTRELQG